MQAKFTDNIMFLGFADNKVPEYKEVKSKDWILFGEDNKFPQHLLYLYNKSSNHNAIVNGKVVYIFGKGYEGGNVKVNSSGETFNKVYKKFAQDIELFGGGRLEVLWKMDGSAELRHIPFQYLRRSKEDNGYWYCKEWGKYSSVGKDAPVFIPDFDLNNKKGVQVFAYNEYRPGADVYPLPGYFGSLNDIETDVEISKYNLSVIKNGMFASKMIVFNNGEPTKEIKAQIERDFKNKFAGSENSGNFMLVFNQDPAKAPIVQDLSTTDLDKLFDQLNKTTQAEIFSGHLVTSPMLFGIMEPGKLGGRNELQDAYEIFKNTYVNDKQMALNEVAELIMPLVGIQPSKVVPTDPINLSLNPVDFKDMLPKEWVLEQLEIDAAKYQPVVTPDSVQPQVNENLKNLTGRQFQQLQRVLNKYRNGKLKKEEAVILLKNSYGLSDTDIETFLSEEQNFSAEYSEDEVAAMFAACGESKKDYTVIKSMHFAGDDSEYMAFADLTQVDSNIINMIRKDKRIDPKDIAAAVKSSPEYVSKRIEELTKDGVITQVTKSLGIDTIIERAINPEVIDYRPKPQTVDVFVKYTYEKKPEAKGDEIIDTTRPFCRRLIQLDRVYTRAEIETISQRLGYSVFDRAGGFWGNKPYCRHEWRRLLVIKKK